MKRPLRTRSYRGVRPADRLWTLFVVLMLVLALFNGATVLKEWHDCSANGGRMVQGLSWNGYVCVEGR